MKLKILALALVFSMFIGFSYADEQSHRAAAEELLLLTGVEKTSETIFERMKLIMDQQFDNQPGLDEEKKEILKKYRERTLKMVMEELDWEKMKDNYIDIYVKTYTEKEIRDISEFFKSPAGRKYIEKLPQLTEEATSFMLKMLPGLMEKMKAVIAEMQNEIQQ